MTLIAAAMGRVPVDTLLTNVRLANTLTGEMYPADIVIYAGKIAAVEPPGTAPARNARDVIDAAGRIATPGLVDAHLHIESTLVTPAHFAEAVLPLGVTTILEDPHEIANVLGAQGIVAFIDASRNVPLKIEFLISSSVPSAVGLETAGGSIDGGDVEELLRLPQVRGLAEVMDGAGLVMEDERLLAILRACGGGDGYTSHSPGVIEGHNPMLRGRALSAFVAAGIDSDHTVATPADLIEKARQGVTLMLQERYLSREVIAAVESLPFEIGTCIITDDVAPDYLLDAGHLDHVMRECIRLGMDPMRALRAVTLNPARRMRLWDRGAIAPGRAADVVLVDDLADFRARLTLVDGKVVARDGLSIWHATGDDGLSRFTRTVKLGPQTPADFTVRALIEEGVARARVMDCVPNSTSTRVSEDDFVVRGGALQLPPDTAFICVVDRHAANGGHRAFGLLRGVGLERGAFASSLAHDSHNLCVIGRTPAEMARAANAVIGVQGGMAVVQGEQTLALMRLPIAGILSAEPVPQAAREARAVYAALNSVGLRHPHWLMRLTTFTLPVSSGLRITDMGLVDAQARKIVSLFV